MTIRRMKNNMRRGESGVGIGRDDHFSLKHVKFDISARPQVEMSST